MNEEKTAAEWLEEAAKHISLDEAMRRDPQNLTDEDFRSLIAGERAMRAHFNIVQAKKKEKSDD